MLRGDVINELHHVDGLTHSGTTKQTNLAAFGKRAYQVNHLNAGLQKLIRSR